MSARSRRGRALAPAALAALLAVALVIGVAPALPAQRHALRVALSLPAHAAAGSSVLASGRVRGHTRARRVQLQRLIGRRWRTLARGRVAHGRYRVSFRAPATPGTIIVRTALYRGRRRVRVSRAHRLVIDASSGATPAPATPPLAPGKPAIAAWGDNTHGQLGGGFRGTKSTLPVGVRGLSNIKAVSATYFSSFALLTDGTARGWGSNTFGELGDGSHGEPIQEPVPLAGLTGITAIAAGGSHGIALLANGTVATWGVNTYGQLGNGTTLEGREGTATAVPIVVPGLSGVVSVAAGGGDDAAVLADGSVVAWGENKSGQLGDGTTVEKDRPTAVHGLTGVRQVALGGMGSKGGHMLALLGDGTVRAIGANGAGQLGDGSLDNSTSPVQVKGLSGVTQVAASESHSLARVQNGTVMSWGSNAYGELGVGSGPEQCPGIDPGPCSKVPVAVKGPGNVSAVSAGWRFSVELSGAHVFTWGWNEDGQLGDGTTTERSTPVPVHDLGEVSEIQAGEKHTLALLASVAPEPLIEVTPGHGSLTVSWRAAETGEKWGVSWRPLVRPSVEWSNHVTLAATTRSYTITGLSVRPYEVRVRNLSFGIKIVSGTPLP